MKIFEKIKELADLCYKKIKLAKQYTVKSPEDIKILTEYIQNIMANGITYPSLFEVRLGKLRNVRSRLSWLLTESTVRTTLWDCYLTLDVEQRFVLWQILFHDIKNEHTVTIDIVDKTGKIVCEVEATGSFVDSIEMGPQDDPKFITRLEYISEDKANPQIKTSKLYFLVAQYKYRLVK